MPETATYIPSELRFYQEIPQKDPKKTTTKKNGTALKLFDNHALQEKRPTEASSLQENIKYFDNNWQKENLPKDWYNLPGIGFMMKRQMSLLEDPGNLQQVSEFTKQTKQDLMGFKLEYLSNHLVYPCKYQINPIDPTRLESLEYKNKDITETVTNEERNGSVKKALTQMKEFFLSKDTTDGSIAVMASPKGESGLSTDNGQSIVYPDSYFFIMQKKADTVTNYTIKTDFTVQETREVIYQLTGKRLSPTAPLEEYVKTIATMNPDHNQNRLSDVLRVLKTVRPSHAYHDKNADHQINWNNVYEDVYKAEELYNFNEKTQKAISGFEEYCNQGDHTKDEIQKAIAATILKMSKIFFAEKKTQQQPVVLVPNKWSNPGLVFMPEQSFGQIFNAVASRPGCAGGGSTRMASWGENVMVVNSIVPRTVTLERSITSLISERTLQCKECPKCGAKDIEAKITQGEIICPVNGCRAPYNC